MRAGAVGERVPLRRERVDARVALAPHAPESNRRPRKLAVVAGERLILCADESTGSLAAARGLRAAGYRVHAAVARPDTFVARSRAVAAVVRVPDAKDEPAAFVEAAAAEARRVGAAAVLPATEGTLRSLTGREDAFDCAVGTGPAGALDRATDEELLARLAAEAGLDVPETVDARTAVPASFPAMLKPAASVSPAADGTLRSREAVRVDGEAALERALAALPDDERWLLQPYVQGTLAAICGVVWEGRLVCASHQVSPRIWPPGRGISSFAVTVPRDAEREAAVARLLAAVGWSGVFGLQFILARDRAYAIDLNPRIYGSLGLAIAAGQNLPAIWVDLLLGREPRVDGYRVGTGYRVEEDDVRAIAVAARRGDLGALRGLLPRPHTTHGALSLRDPAPFLVTLRKLLPRS
jgi:predicted ATP-grasp superfamily ATP-dependent carboligase